jgi:hypothetical protein
LLPGWGNIPERPVLKPQLAVASKYKDLCARQSLKSIFVDCHVTPPFSPSLWHAALLAE